MVYAAQGKRAEALKVIKELEEMSGASLDLSHYIAKVYASLNEKELALTWLEHGLAPGAMGDYIKTTRSGMRSAVTLALAICCGGWASRNKSDRRYRKGAH